MGEVDTGGPGAGLPDGRTLPALAAGLWLVPGILTAWLGAAGSLPVWAATLLALAAGGLLWLIQDRAGRRFAILLPLAALLTLLHLAAPWQTCRTALPRAECAVEIEAIITEPVSREDVAAPGPGLRASLVRLRTPGGNGAPWRNVRGDILLRLPRETVVTPPYGSRVRAIGAMLEPDAAPFLEDFDYRAYLRTRGVFLLFQVQTLEITGPVCGWRWLPAALYRGRDALLDRICAGVASPAQAGILAAVIFSRCEELAPELRARFLQSGTIHIFSVSGLHVAILASILLPALALAGLPFRMRHALLPPLLGLYVVMTGSEAAAVRSWLMIALWAAGRAWFQAVNPLNSVAAAALILLLWNPLQLFQTGFQFSFLLVFFLIAGWHVVRRFRDWIGEADAWRPERCRPHRFWRGLRARLADLAAGSLLGWAAAAGLVAWTNQRLILSCLWINPLTGLTVWWMLFLACLKLPASFLISPWWPGPERLLARGLDLSVRLTDALAEAGRDLAVSLPVVRPPLAAVILFYLILATALGRRFHPGLRTAGAGMVLLGIFILPFLPGELPAGTAQVFSGDGAGQPGLIWRPVAATPPVVVLPDSFTLARAMLQQLVRSGHGTAALIVAGPGCPPAALELFRCGLRGESLLLLEGGGRRLSPALRLAALNLAVAGVRIRTAASGEAPQPAGPLIVTWTTCAVGRRLELRHPAPARVLTTESETAAGGARASLTETGNDRGTEAAPLRLPLRRRPVMAVLNGPGLGDQNE